MDETPAPFQGPQSTQACTPEQLERAKSKRVLVGVLGRLVGCLGIHKFVLGYRTAGIIMLAVTVAGSVVSACLCLPGSGAAVTMWIIGIIEGILYLSKSDEEFCQTYICKKRDWF